MKNTRSRTRRASTFALCAVSTCFLALAQETSDKTVEDGADDGKPVHGERLAPDAVGEGRIESMDVVLERERSFVQPTENKRARNGRQGEWVTPNPKFKYHPHSGEVCVLNKWGDTSMGIGMPETVDVEDAWIASQGGFGAWAEAVRVVGFRDGERVGESAWLEEIDETPRRLVIGLEDVDRIVVEAKPSASGAGFYALDDLRYRNVEGEEVVVDFEDARFSATLTGTQYAGLTWQVGTGTFTPPPPKIVPAPQTGAAHAKPPAVIGGTSAASSRGGAGTLPAELQNFRGPRLGDAGASFIPPDTCGAVGVDHYCAIVNANLSIYDKATGSRIQNTSLQSFWGAGVGDPRIAYDFAHDRWVAIATPFNDRIFIAYSMTNDPTGAWFKSSFIAAQGSDSGRWVDYPTLGVDSRGIFIAAYMVGSGARMTIFAIDKAPLLQASPSLGTITAFRSLLFDGAIQHASQYTDAGASYMISTRSSTTLRLRRIDPPMTNPTLSTNQIPGAQNYSNPPNAPAMGSTVDLSTGDSRMMNACYANGSLWAAHCIASAGRSAARWYEVDPVSMSILQQGTVSDPNLWFHYPSIAADSSGNAVMGFSGSSPTLFPSVYYTGRVGSDPAGEMGVPVRYSTGAASYTVTDSVGRNRWGDYSLTTLDPVDGTFWTIQERTRTIANSWVTWVSQLDHSGCVGSIDRYCTAQSNPTGFPASIGSTGTTSVAANDLDLTCVNLPNSTFGLFFYGMNQTSAPVGDGTLCIGNPFFRLPPVQASPTGIAMYDLDLTNLPPGAQPILSGEVWNFSFWYRQVSPAAYNFSDALSIRFCD